MNRAECTPFRWCPVGDTTFVIRPCTDELVHPDFEGFVILECSRCWWRVYLPDGVDNARISADINLHLWFCGLPELGPVKAPPKPHCQGAVRGCEFYCRCNFDKSRPCPCLFCGKSHDPHKNACPGCLRGKRLNSQMAVRTLTLHRDNYTCQDCGVIGGNGIVDLHVDHIIPYSQGGGIEEWNLQTLCQACNQHKRDDWHVGCDWEQVRSRRVQLYRFGHITGAWHLHEVKLRRLEWEMKTFERLGTWDPIIQRYFGREIDPTTHQWIEPPQ